MCDGWRGVRQPRSGKPPAGRHSFPEAQLGQIRAPTQITFGRHDMVTSTRFANRLKNDIRNSELYIFEDCSHAPLYENVAAFNEKTLAFLKKHAG